jgi:hypothetical protein
MNRFCMSAISRGVADAITRQSYMSTVTLMFESLSRFVDIKERRFKAIDCRGSLTRNTSYNEYNNHSA